MSFVRAPFLNAALVLSEDRDEAGPAKEVILVVGPPLFRGPGGLVLPVTFTLALGAGGFFTTG